MSVPTEKNLSDKIVPHVSSALIDLHLGNIVLLFSYDLIQKRTVTSLHCRYYIFQGFFWGLDCI